MRAAVFPSLPATDKLPVLSIEPKYMLKAAALLNSMVFDFLVRVHLSGGSLKAWVLDQCAAPPPECIPAKVAPLAEEMSITSYTVAESTGRPVHPWDPQRRWLIDAMLDALIAQAYGLSLYQYGVVLDHFALLRRMEEREVGEYRSKRLRLEAFEDLQGDA